MPADQRDVICMGHHAQHIKLGREERRGAHIWSDCVLSSQVTITHDGALLSCR